MQKKYFVQNNQVRYNNTVRIKYKKLKRSNKIKFI